MSMRWTNASSVVLRVLFLLNKCTTPPPSSRTATKVLLAVMYSMGVTKPMEADAKADVVVVVDDVMSEGERKV
jgi:hypothetical protein